MVDVEGQGGCSSEKESATMPDSDITSASLEGVKGC